MKLQGEEVEEVKEVEERKIRPGAAGGERFYPLLPSLPLPPQLPFPPFRHVYLLGAAEIPPAGFLIVLLYAFSSSMTQNHSAISQVGSSLWSLGGLTQTFVYALGSSMMICISRVS